MKASSVLCYVRLRPESEEVSAVNKSIFLTDNKADISINNLRNEFTFDKIFDAKCSQDYVFKVAAIPILNEALEGINGCIIAYGQTGAGKTYTMSGPSCDNYIERGMTLRSVGHLFETIRNITRTSQYSFSVSLSVVEIYNEQVTDLLRPEGDSLFLGGGGSRLPSPQVQMGGKDSSSASASIPSFAPKDSSNKDGHNLTVVETVNGVVIPSLFIVPISNEEEGYSFLLDAYQSRTVKEHKLNRKSNRSHVIYTFYITRTKFNDATSVDNTDDGNSSSNDDDIVQSKLHMVDLAGSERNDKTGSIGSVQKEASYINKSLSYLEQVVLALTQSNREHIPYRQSKLTFLLKDTIGGNYKTVLIACIWTHRAHLHETLSTLRFAQRMKCVENRPIRNSLMTAKRGSGEPSGEQVASQKSMIEILKQELRLRDSLHNTDRDIWLPKLTPKQRKDTIDLAVKVANAANSSDVFEFGSNVYNNYYAREGASNGGGFVFDVHSVSQVNLIVGTLQSLLFEACDGDASTIAHVVERTLIKNKLISPPSPQPPPRSINDAASATAAVAQQSSPLMLDGSPERQDAHDDFDNDTIATSRTNGSNRTSASAYRLSSRPADGGARKPAPSRSTERAADILSKHAMNGILTDEMNELFEEFVGTEEGAFLYNNYMESKSTCQSSKIRLKELVGMVNKQSSEIESLKQQQLLQSISNNMELFNDLQSLITMAKMDYRAYHSELMLCKEQISDTQALRKRALQLFLAAFEKFCTNNSGENKVIDIEES